VTRLLFAFCLLSSATLAEAQPVDPKSMVMLHEDGRPPAAASPADVTWLIGSWVGDMEGLTVEHVILPERFGQLPGFVRASGGDGIAFYEVTTFRQAGNSISYRVKHFTSALAGWEAQDAYIDRPLLKRDADNLYFDGITFSRTSPDSFTVYFLDRNRKVTLVIPFRRARKTD